VLRDRFQVSRQPGPAREAVLAGDDRLGRAEPQAACVAGGAAGVVAGQPGEGVGVAGPHGALQGAGLPAEAVEVGTLWHVQGRHDGLLSSA
jgi:hypothetical protein